MKVNSVNIKYWLDILSTQHMKVSEYLTYTNTKKYSSNTQMDTFWCLANSNFPG